MSCSGRTRWTGREAAVGRNTSSDEVDPLRLAAAIGEVQDEREKTRMGWIIRQRLSDRLSSAGGGGGSMSQLDELLTDPYLPMVGEVYWIATEILDGYDVEPRRPGVVVQVPATLDGRITVVTRTTQPGKPGVSHDPDPDLDLHKRGTFSYVRTAEARLWKRPHVEWMGTLDEDLVKLIIEDRLG